MDRKNFLKGMFGAAIVASMPKIVVDQIEKVEQIAPNHNDLSDVQGGFSHSVKEQRMYLYDDNKLIASSDEFSLSWKKEPINVSRRPDSIIPVYPEYWLGQPEWNIEARLFWNDKEEGLFYFAEEKPLQVVICNEGVKFKGNAYIMEFHYTSGLEDYAWEDVMLSGVGEIIIDVENE